MELQHINGRMMSFEDEGAGEPLVLLHAFPVHSGMWRHQRQAFKGRYRVITPNLPGFAGSEVISPNASPMDRMGDSVAVLMEALRVPRAVVGGCSMGGYAALALARRYPKIVRGLVLTNSRASADTDEGKQNREKTAQALMQRGLVELEENLLPKLTAPGARAEAKAEILAMLREASPVGAAAATRGMAGRLDNREWLSRCPVPVLVVHAEDDVVIKREESEEMARTAPQGTLAVIPGAGHLAPLEQPAAWNEAVQKWLAALPR